MRAAETPLFTPTEAAVVTGLAVKAVNNAIDKKIVTTMSEPGRAGGGTRLLDLRALLSLTLERRLADRLVPDARRELLAAVAEMRCSTVSLDGGFLRIDLREPRRELAASLRQLRRARQMVVADPDIMGGDPVFRSTRIPVHLIADILAQGDSEQDILASYPRLTAEMVRLAPIYAAAYPLRGRPRAQPWRDQAPRHQSRRKLGTIEA